MDGWAKRAAAIVAGMWCVGVASGGIDTRPWLTAAAQTTCGANPIVCENQLAGDNDFDVSAAGDPSIEGFASDISVNTGQPIGFKIKTDSTNYEIAIYRLGYYGDAGARKITTLGAFHAAAPQPDCLTDGATGLVDCGNWNETTSWDTDGATSGVYVAKLNRFDPPGSSHIVFIVRDDARSANILFQTSDTTWQAYNRWGGASLYCGGPISNAGTEYGCPGRAVKVSYNRPFDTRAHDPQSFLFSAEYPMLRWLEANGYDVKYWSGVDSDRFGAELSGAHRPRAFLSVGHDEYWSGSQRARVEQARNAGVNLAFFSGNEVYWKTRWEPSLGATPVPHRTLVSYKETLRNDVNNAPLDPLNTGAAPVSTATWRDTRFGAPADGGRPENSLTGTLWTVNCCASEIIVPASMKALRFWRNTRITDLAPGENAKLSRESLGYEWDEDVDNGFRPSGLVRLSLTTLPDQDKIADFGTKVERGTATHSLTLYKHQSGALVFGAGTVQWSWGLDSTHDAPTPEPRPPDQAMQQATVNLLADMGIDPALLQAGADPARRLINPGKSTDLAAPLTTIVSPAAGTIVHSGARAIVTGTAFDQAGVVAGVEVSVDGGTTWRQAQGTASWSFEWTVGAVGLTTVRARAIDDSGNLEAAGPGIILNAQPGVCPCTNLFPGSPVPGNASFDDPSALELGVKFRSDIDGFISGIRYYKSAANSGTHTGSLWTASGTRLATATFAAESAVGWQQVLFDAPVRIDANAIYVASYHTDTGHYAAAVGFFDTGLDSPPLHALSSVEAGGNGVFFAGGSVFPNRSFGATNYWVDVVFSATSDDTTAPVISELRQTTIDSANVVITWTTSEAATSRVDISTDSSFAPASTRTVSTTGFATAHVVAIGSLIRNTTYFYRVTSIDRTGNAATSEAPSFTLPGPTLRDTAHIDFAAGQFASTYAAQTDDGELILAPAVGAEFSAPGVPAGWTAVPWMEGGAATALNGVLVVDGARVGTCTTNDLGNCTEAGAYGPGRSLEFVARFGGDAFQHAGFGLTLGSTAEPWAIFSTLGGDGLYARTNTGAAATDTFLGSSYLGGPHRYRIDWRANGTIEYFIDGRSVATGPAVTASMRPIAASDFNFSRGTVDVDWMRMTPYTSAGTFLSRVFDAEGPATWNSVQWTASTPAGTGVSISVRAGGTPAPGPGWSAFVPVVSSGPISLAGQYVQYRAELSSNNPESTPSLDDIIISTGHAPVASDDTATVTENGILVFAASGPGSLTANDVDVDSAAGDLRVFSVSQPAHGTTALLPDGRVSYTPAVNYKGADSFTYVMTDGLLTSSASVFITVRDANVAPTAAADAFSIDEDTSLIVGAAAGLLANDSDADGDVLHVVLVSPPAHGTLALGADGAFTYTPEPNFAGSDAFLYLASDGSLDSNVAAVQITIRQVNDPPIAQADTFAMLRGQTLAVGAPGVLQNDRDVEVEDVAPLHATLVSAPAHGTLSLDANGGFVYTPEADFVGVDRFTYAAADHFNAAGNVVTVAINVQIAETAGNTAAGGTIATGSGVTSSDPLQTAVTTPTPASVTIVQGVLSTTQVTDEFSFLNRQVNITVRNASDGAELSAPLDNPLVLSFTIDASLIPPLETAETLQIFRNGVNVPACSGAATITSAQLDPCVTRRQAGANGAVTIVLLTTHASEWNLGVESVNPAPVARDDGPYFTTLNAALVVPAPGVLGNDIGRASLTAALLANGRGGAIELGAGGGFRFTPESGFCGRATFSYAARDGVHESNPGTGSIDVNCDPVAVDDAFTVLEDSGTSTFTVLANDSDPEGQVVRITAVTQPAHGVVAVSPQGTWVTYTPQPDDYGPDSFTYTITDGRGGSATASVDVTVAAVNDVPSFTAGPDQTTTAGAGLQTVAGWARNLSAGPANEATQTLSLLVTTTNPSLFSVLPAISSTGTLTYTPAASGGGAAVVTVKVRDSGGTTNGGIDTSAAQTFTITLPFPTTTTLTSPTASPTTYGQSVVLKATVTSSGGTPQGSVDFLDNGILLGSAALVSGTASYTTAAIGAGTSRTVTAIYRPDAGFVTSQGTLVRSVTALATTTTAAVTLSVQYSDLGTFETTVTGSPAGAPAQSASFRIGTEVIGTVPLVWDGTVYRAKLVTPMVESTYTSGPTGGPLKPAAKTVAITYNSVSPNYTLANRSASMQIVREDALVAYAGPTSVTCASCSAVAVQLRAVVSETDALHGDLRNATVSFVNRTTGAILATVPVNPDGTATYAWTVNLGTATTQTTKIGMVVGGYYLRNNTLDDGTVTIRKQ